MRYEIAHGPAFTTLELTFETGEAIVAQPGSMIAMTGGFDLTTRAGAQMGGSGGGIGRALRSLAVGESLFAAIYTARRDGERLTLAPDQMGDLRAIEVGEGSRMLISSGAFLACTSGVSVKPVYAGVKGILATHGLFLMETQGSGTLFVAGYGALEQRDLREGEFLVLDDRYLVAMTAGLPFEAVQITGSLRHALLSGEGYVSRFAGPGAVILQTRTRPSRGFFRDVLGFAT